MLPVQAPRPSLADEAPLQDPGAASASMGGLQQSPPAGEGNSSMSVWGGVLSAIDVYSPPAPVMPHLAGPALHAHWRPASCGGDQSFGT